MTERETIQSLERQLQGLSSMIRELRQELDRIRVSGYGPSCIHVCVSTDGKHVCDGDTLLSSQLTPLGRLEPNGHIVEYYPEAKVKILSPGPDNGKLLDMASAERDAETVAIPLSNREVQILALVAEGNTNKQIARILGISEQTVKNHITAILLKLNANDRAHAVALALRRGWLPTLRSDEMVTVS